MRAFRGYGLHKVLIEGNGKVLGKPAKEGESPVFEIGRERAESEVHRDTRNLDGSRGDHPPRLNTTQ